MKAYLLLPPEPASFLPWALVDHHNQIHKRLSGQFDPRLLPALWLHSIAGQLRFGEPVDDILLPFRWASALDLVEISPFEAVSCKSLKDRFHIHDEISGFCHDIQAPWAFPQVKITLPCDDPMTEVSRRILGASYLMHSMKTPARVVLLGVGPKKIEKTGFRGLVVPLTELRGSSIYEKSDIIALASDYLKSGENCEIGLQDQIEKLQTTWSQSDGHVPFSSELAIPADHFRFINEEDHAVSGDISPAEVNFTPELLEKYFSKRARDNELDSTLARNFYAAQDSKYFHEAKLLGTSCGSHYDWRFFKTSQYSTYERTSILHRLSRAWLRFSNDVGLKSWLAHGTLLGWHWNGLNMPWDQDLDVQMTLESLFLLARNYNQSMVADFSDNANYAGSHMYLVDVNPHFCERQKGGGENVIDARFIDMTSGMYVDITGLAITEDLDLVQKARGKPSRELHKVFDSEYGDMIKSADSDPEFEQKYHSHLKQLEQHLWRQGHLYNCKNLHFYTKQELEPLQRTTFEGVSAFVPNDYQSVLAREYKRGLRLRQFQDWTFRTALGLWVPNKVAKAPNENWLLEEEYTRGVRKSGSGEQGPVKVDPWMMQRGEEVRRLGRKNKLFSPEQDAMKV